MRTLIAVSRCIKAQNGIGEFSFRGFYSGIEIMLLVLKMPPDVEWKKREDYVLYIRVLSVEGGLLKGVVLRSRELDQLMCKD